MEIASVNNVLRLFSRLTKLEQFEVAEKINNQTFEERWTLIDTGLPDLNISEDEIIKELRAVRYGKEG